MLVTQKTIYCQPSVHRFHFVGQWVHRPDARRHSISAVSERPVTEQSWAFPEMSVSVTTAVSRWGSWGATFVFVAPQPMATPKMMKRQKFCEPQNEPLGAKGESRKSIPNWLYDAWCMSVCLDVCLQYHVWLPNGRSYQFCCWIAKSSCLVGLAPTFYTPPKKKLPVSQVKKRAPNGQKRGDTSGPTNGWSFLEERPSRIGDFGRQKDEFRKW